MPLNDFIVREPLVDHKQQVFGYEIFLQHTGIYDRTPSDEELSSLLSCAANDLNDQENGWGMGETLLFIEVSPQQIDSPTLQLLPPESTVLIVNAGKLDSPDSIAALKMIREMGFGVLLRQANIRELNKDWLSYVTHVEVDMEHVSVSELAKVYGALKQDTAVRMVANQISEWHVLDKCSSLELDAFVGKLHLTMRDGYRPKGINPSQALVFQLLGNLRRNAEINELENLLKKDAAISYKLLRFINSAGFGRKSEVQSLRHAVSLIGYTPLYRWLVLLLATSATGENVAILMQTAIVRGRMVELLGEGVFSKNEQDSMFIMGMFTLLDRLLGIPIQDALKHIPLPEPAMQALISREGKLGNYLALAEACELRNGLACALAESLPLQPEQVNKAHMQALAWAQNFIN